MNRLFVIDDVDDEGRCGITCLLAQSADEATNKFHMYHGKDFLKIVAIEEVEVISLAMVGAKDKAFFARRNP